MVEVRRRERESTEAMLRRFTRRVQQSGDLQAARAKRFNSGEKSKRKQRDSAVKRVQFLFEKKKLVKQGKVRSMEQRLPNKYKLKIKESIR
jgi:ribosomal protein S21